MITERSKKMTTKGNMISAKNLFDALMNENEDLATSIAVLSEKLRDLDVSFDDPEFIKFGKDLQV